MKPLSNQTITVLLAASIVISVLGTLSNLQKLEGNTPSISGFATTGTGKVNVSVASVTSITISDALLNFGECSPNASGSYIASNDSTTSWGAPGVCTVDGSAPTTTDSLNITNDGNDDVNISFTSDSIASTFIEGTNPQFMYTTTNVSARPGCRLANKTTAIMFNDTESNLTGLQRIWLNISSASVGYPVCSNLSYPDTTDSVAFYVRLFLPSDVTAGGGEKSATLTFTAASLA
tara:strand:- start:402 stop:1103 length:702 start_codon:yes stop_codon:yes gene_type:complete